MWGWTRSARGASTKPGPAWQVTHWRGATQKDAVRLVAPGQRRTCACRATRSTSRHGPATAASTSALSGAPAQARLDIYVSYELEVNVDTSLTPAIDDLNTDGPIGVRCDVDGA